MIEMNFTLEVPLHNIDWTIFDSCFTFKANFKNAEEVVDRKSKDYFSLWLSENLSSDRYEFYETPDFSHVDMAVFDKVSNTVTGFELKIKRKGEDGWLKEKKLNNICSSINKFRAYNVAHIKCALVAFFPDNCFRMWNVFNYDGFIYKDIQHIQCFENGSKELERTKIFTYPPANACMSVMDSRISDIFTESVSKNMTNCQLF